MAGSISLLALLLAAEPTQPPPEGYCVDCHKREGEPRLFAPTASIAASVHKELEGLCVACHGGDVREPTKRAHDKALGFRGKPGPEDVPRVCGGCHADAAYMRRFSPSIAIDQAALYRVSGHGKALENGETKVATCITCHGAHDVRRVSDPKSPVFPANVAGTCGGCHSDLSHPAAKKSKADPQRAWRKSVHAAQMASGDSSAPTCNDCHGDHGAAPPGVRDIHNACGACHAEQSERFKESVHAAEFARLGFGECNECHGRHDVQAAGDFMLLPTERGVCRRCHADGEKGHDEAAKIYRKVGLAASRAGEAVAILEGAKRRGLAVPEAEVAEKEMQTSLRRLRIAIHDMKAEGLDPEWKAVVEQSEIVVQKVGVVEGDAAMKRRGYGVFIFVLAFVAFLLFLKIRRLPA